MFWTFHYVLLALLANDASTLHTNKGPHHGRRAARKRGHNRDLVTWGNEKEERSVEALANKECSYLQNVEGTHYILSVEVGTPPQNFNLIPDTGSPWVIVADKNCTACECGVVNKCYAETNSSSLHVPMTNGGVPELHSLMFGSGPIQVAVATDIVRIGQSDVSVSMTNGVLLMLSHQLSFTGPFEGIIGLGIPEHLLEPKALTAGKHTYQDGMLEKAGVYNFSVCFSDDGWGGSGGVLGFGNLDAHAKKLEITHQTMHWQVPFYGLSIADNRLNFCQKPKKPNQHSPCAAVFDSGTTYILGPMSMIMPLYENFCTEWPRCMKLYTQMLRSAEVAKKQISAIATGDHAPVPTVMDKSMVFQLLLNNCTSWLDNVTGVSEMPKMHFHVGSRSGDKMDLHLDPWDFIVAQEDNATEITFGNFNGVEFVSGYRRTQERKLACAAAFATMEFPTALNGPAWIIGMPIFYSYVVSYNIGTNPPSVSFDDRPCGTCTEDSKSLYDKKASPRKSIRGQPRRVSGEPHLPAQARHIVF